MEKENSLTYSKIRLFKCLGGCVALHNLPSSEY